MNTGSPCTDAHSDLTTPETIHGHGYPYKQVGKQFRLADGWSVPAGQLRAGKDRIYSADAADLAPRQNRTLCLQTARGARSTYARRSLGIYPTQDNVWAVSACRGFQLLDSLGAVTAYQERGVQSEQSGSRRW